MAKATATCKCSVCGETFFYHKICRNSSDARSFEEWAAENITVCSDCQSERAKAAREAENKESAALAEERGLPALEGTEKQTAWANTIREKFIHDLDDTVDKSNATIAKLRQSLEEGEALNKKIEYYEKNIEAAMATINFIAHITKASWFIDRRFKTVTEIHLENREKIDELPARVDSAATASDDVVAIAKEEMTVAPENQTHTGSVEITVTDNEVATLYAKDEQFRAIVKGLGYSWKDGRWRKQITITTGSAAERAAELGNKLLNAGFAVRIADEDIRSAAIDGRYEPQTYRWITMIGNGENAGKLFIRWGENDDLYKAAKAIAGSKYVRPGVAVSASNFAQVEDFAAAYGFKFSAGAKKAIEDAKAAVMIVHPAPQKDATYTEHPISDVLNTSADVLDDLKD